MQDNYGDETKRAAAVKTGGADVPAAAAETAVPAASNTDTPTMPPGHKLVDPFTHYAAIEGGDAFFNGDWVGARPREGTDRRHRGLRGQHARGAAWSYQVRQE